MLPPTVIEGRLRRALLLLAGFIFSGTLVELWLVDHMKEPIQVIPFVLCGLGILVVAGVLIAPQRRTLYALRGVMLVVMVGSVIGMYEHLEGNFAFEMEIRPGATTGDVVMPAFKGANPLMAPGMLAVAAALALLAAYYHPQLARQQA
jgi:hypothetical protein